MSMTRHVPVVKGKPLYVLAMFPYPSGMLHMGHARVYAIADTIARHRRATGNTVFAPMGWDSFGLPAEVAAAAHGIDPCRWTEQNIAVMRRQIVSMDTAFDFSHELATHEPTYHKWSQWLFLQLLKHGLAYRAKAPVKWDPVLRTVLANEQIIDGNRSERSGAIVEERVLQQWFIRTSEYKSLLLSDMRLLTQWPSDMITAHRAFLSGTDKESGLHDWLVSRQRRWGTPIPVINCDSCGPIPSPTLPVTSPDHGKKCICPRCGSPNAMPESDTLDTFFDSSFYWLRFISPHSKDTLCDRKLSDTLLPVDFYIGGKEHIALHIVYARFMAKFLHKIGLITAIEPFRQFVGVGAVTSETYSVDGENSSGMSRRRYIKKEDVGKYPSSKVIVKREKMSKSKLNGVDPSLFAETYGSDVLRLYLLHKAPVDKSMEWSVAAINGPIKFVQKVREIAKLIADSKVRLPLVERSVAENNEIPQNSFIFDRIVAMTGAMESLKFHVAIGELYVMLDKIYAEVSSTPTKTTYNDFKTFLRLIYPCAPSLAKEMMTQISEPCDVDNDLSRYPSVQTRRRPVLFIISVDSKVVAKCHDRDFQIAEYVVKENRLVSSNAEKFIRDLFAKKPVPRAEYTILLKEDQAKDILRKCWKVYCSGIGGNGSALINIVPQH